MCVDVGSREDEARIYVLDDNGNWVLRRQFNSFENDFRPASDVSPDNEMLVVHRPENAELTALYTYDIAENQYKDVIFEQPGHDLVTVGLTKFGGDLMYVGWFEDQLKKNGSIMNSKQRPPTSTKRLNPKTTGPS